MLPINNFINIVTYCPDNLLFFTRNNYLTCVMFVNVNCIFYIIYKISNLLRLPCVATLVIWNYKNILIEYLLYFFKLHY